MTRKIELKNSQREIHSFRLRLFVGLGFAGLLMLALLARVFYLQVLQHGHFDTLAESNRIYVVPIATRLPDL